MKIKRCPFCGGESIDFDIDYGNYGYTPNIYHIECECGASMTLVDDFKKSNEECRDELIKRWNKRIEDKE